MASSTRIALSRVNLRWPLLRHSFYQRWTQGTLTIDELRSYSDQYRHLVAALPGWLSSAAQSHPIMAAELRLHAREETAHIPLWDEFRRAIGASAGGADPNSATGDVIAKGDALAGQGLGTAVAWALEAQAPEVSRAKAEGLARHYGIDGAGAAYFELHSRMDVAHARELETAIEELPEELRTRAPEAADAVLSRVWEVLTSAEQLAGVGRLGNRPG
jgi:pyrroloquinoline-quinone synthase